MNSTSLKVLAAVMVSLALLLGLFVINVYRKNELRAKEAEAKTQQQASQTLAVVATKPLAAYKPIDREAVALVPVAVAPLQYFTTLDDVIGRVPLMDIDAGAPVTGRYFKEGNLLAKIIPAGHQAISVEVNDILGVGGFVRPGDIVDVLLYLRGSGGGSGIETQARVLLKDVRVLAYEERIIDRPQGLKDEEKEKDKGSSSKSRQRTAVLAVPEADTTKLMLGVSLGELRLALHSQNPAGDEQTAPVADGGVPISEQALAEQQAAVVPDKAVLATDLARISAPPKLEQARKKAPPPPTVEVYRGSQRERVVTKN